MKYVLGLFLFFLIIVSGDSARAESIVLRSGKMVQAKILEKTAEYIKVDYEPAPLYYCWDSIASIDGEALPGRARKATPQREANQAAVAPAGASLKELLNAKDMEIESLRKQLKESQQAAEDFAAMKKDFKRLQAKYYNNLGGMYLYEKAFDNAADAFEDALEIDPWNVEACFNLALVYDNYMRNSSVAVNFYERYLTLVPNARDRRQIEERIAQLKS